MNILIVGCTKVGIRIASLLSYHGHDVAVVDKDPDKIKDLGDDFEGLTLAGVPVDEDVLTNAGIKSCDAVAAVTDDDSINIVVSQIAKNIYHVPTVIASIFDPAKENVFKHFGLSAVCPTRLTADALYTAIVDKGEDKTLSFGSATLGFSVVPLNFTEKRIKSRRISDYPIYSGTEILGVIHSDGICSLYSKLTGNYILKDDDKLLLTRVVD